VVYGRGGRAALARVLGPYLGVATPVSLTDLLARLSVRGDPRAAYPWYGDVTDPEPAPGPAPAAFRRLYVNPVCEREFNAGCEGAGGKAGLLFRETMRLVRRALADSAPEADAVVVCDRHGGRRRYAALLMAELEPATLVTERESAAVSSYRLQRRGRPIHIRFVRQADATDKAVALASMAAKYVRELFMEGLNAYFSARVDDLRPTAGYYSDGRRFLRDVEAVLSELDCERDTFVRVS
jgi:ribonuclease HII